MGQIGVAVWHRHRRRGWGGRTAGEGRHYICAGPSNRAQYRPDRRRVRMLLLCLDYLQNARKTNCRQFLYKFAHVRCPREGQEEPRETRLRHPPSCFLIILFLFLSFSFFLPFSLLLSFRLSPLSVSESRYSSHPLARVPDVLACRINNNRERARIPLRTRIVESVRCDKSE